MEIIWNSLDFIIRCMILLLLLLYITWLQASIYGWGGAKMFKLLMGINKTLYYGNKLFAMDSTDFAIESNGKWLKNARAKWHINKKYTRFNVFTAFFDQNFPINV